LLDVGHRTIPVRFTDRLTNRVTAIAGDDDELVDDIDCSVEYLFKQRTITHRKKRFWTPICQGPHAGPAAGREHDSIHIWRRRRAGFYGL